MNQIAQLEKFTAILWFSARDIDLLPDGAKQVKPHVLTEQEIAEEFTRIVAPYVMSSDEFESKKFSPLDFFRANLTESSLGGPILFVFDNFETVKSPIELYNWIDTYLRSPNKVLITSRFRDFKGDNPVTVHGMNEDECNLLIDATCRNLNISHLITPEYRQELYSESEGHPYVVKILLGEVAGAKQAIRVERVLASQEDVLDTLFERTYSRLSPVAKRVFLTLCNWKSVVPHLALEAVLLRPGNERMDVAKAIEELHASSLIELIESAQDQEIFVLVPLVAAIFGQRKLSVSPMKSAIQADTNLLYYFGAAKQSDIQHGVGPRIERLFRTVASQLNKYSLQEYVPILEFVSRNYSPAWLLLAKLFEEEGDRDKAKEMLLRYLEFSSDEDVLTKREVWSNLAYFYKIDNDYSNEVHALIELCQLPDTPFDTLSNTANRLNLLFRSHEFYVDTDEKQIIVRTLVDLMETRFEEGDATDCSRLAWLCLHLQDKDRARGYAQHGLAIDPNNQHCQNILQRL